VNIAILVKGKTEMVFRKYLIDFFEDPSSGQYAEIEIYASSRTYS